MKAATAAGSGRSLPTARQVAKVSGSGVRIAVMTAGGGYRPRFNAELVETPTAEEKGSSIHSTPRVGIDDVSAGE